MIAPGHGNDPRSETAALLARAKEQRKQMAEIRRSLDAVRAGVRGIQESSWRAPSPEETRRRAEDLSKATRQECALSRELIRTSTELVETTREILQAQRADREQRRDAGRETGSLSTANDPQLKQCGGAAD